MAADKMAADKMVFQKIPRFDIVLHKMKYNNVCIISASN